MKSRTSSARRASSALLVFFAVTIASSAEASFECLPRGEIRLLDARAAKREKASYCWDRASGALRSAACHRNPTACEAAFVWRRPAALENPSLLSFGSPDYRICLAAGGHPERIQFSWKGKNREISRCVSADGKWFASTGQVASWILK